MDGNGRIKLSADVQRDFERHTEGDVVLYCVPEGAVGVFPPDAWAKIRAADLDPISRYADSLVYRRTLRRFGALSAGTSISKQGRITIPSSFRSFASLTPGESVLLIGCEIGLEIWNPALWRQELAAINRHLTTRGSHELDADLQAAAPHEV